MISPEKFPSSDYWW